MTSPSTSDCGSTNDITKTCTGKKEWFNLKPCCYHCQLNEEKTAESSPDSSGQSSSTPSGDASEGGEDGTPESTDSTQKMGTQRRSDSLESLVSKRKKRKKASCICTTNCRFDVVRQIAKKCGMKEVKLSDAWNIYWTDFSVSVERAKEMKRFQKVNHFPGMAEICRKDLLARNLNRMLKIFPTDYDFFPKTWCLPTDQSDALAYWRSHRSKTFILKPELGCRGQGIYLTKNLKNVKAFEKMICQVYISRPFLVDGYKFDLRIYTLITSCDPLRIYVYNEGLVRFATSRYKEPNQNNMSNMYMHLTNYSVNKHSRTYVVDDEGGSKRRISTLNLWLERKMYNVRKIWESIDEVIVKTILVSYPTIKHSYQACFPAHDYMQACFELLGFDILLDRNLKPFVLEVNHSPSFHTDAQIDREIKEALLMDTFTILNLPRCDKRKVMMEDRRRIRDRLLNSISGKEELAAKAFSHTVKAAACRQMQVNWEENNMGNYRRVYPGPNDEKYDVFLCHMQQSTIFNDTLSSKAREEASRMHREELKEKARAEVMRSVLTQPQNQPSVNAEINAGAAKAIRKHVKLAKKIRARINSFEKPSKEMTAKEKLKIKAEKRLIQRSTGLMTKIYGGLKLNGKRQMEREIEYGRSENQTKPYITQGVTLGQNINAILKILSQRRNKALGVPLKPTLLQPPLPSKKMLDDDTRIIAISRQNPKLAASVNKSERPMMNKYLKIHTNKPYTHGTSIQVAKGGGITDYTHQTLPGKFTLVDLYEGAKSLYRGAMSWYEAEWKIHVTNPHDVNLSMCRTPTPTPLC